MAIPFCFTHEIDWQEGCQDCIRGKSVRDMMDEHVAVYENCRTWPLCDHRDRSVRQGEAPLGL